MNMSQSIDSSDLEEKLGSTIDEFISMESSENFDDVSESLGNGGEKLEEIRDCDASEERPSSSTSLRGKDRPSAMEVLQAVSTESKEMLNNGQALNNGRNGQILNNGSRTEDGDDEVDNAPSHEKIEFRVVTPNMSRMISENGSDSGSPVNPVMLSDTLVPRSNTNSPFIADTTAYGGMETDLGLGPMERNPLLTALDSAKVEDSMETETDVETETSQGNSEATNFPAAIDNGFEEPVDTRMDTSMDTPSELTPSSPQKARRGRGRGRGRSRGRGILKIKMFQTRSKTNRANLIQDDESNQDIPGPGEMEDAPETSFPQSLCVTPTKTSSPAEGRGRGRGRKRGAKWSRQKRRQSRDVVSTSMDTEPEEPVYEGVSPTGLPADFSPLGIQAFLPSPPKMDDESTQNSVTTDDGSSRMVDVERRIEEIQSLVSNIQKQISTSAPIVPSSTSGESSLKSSPDKSCSSPRNNLKMKIKLSDKKKRGPKRHRKDSYHADDEYHPTQSRKIDLSIPTRHSERKSEHDLFLDKMKYLASYSDDSRSPSPQRMPPDEPQPSTSGMVPYRKPPMQLSVSSKLLLSRCKTFNIQLFDFVKCFNINDLSLLDDLNFNKDIRRQIRALEKGHQIARMKSKVLQFNANLDAMKPVETPAVNCVDAGVMEPLPLVNDVDNSGFMGMVQPFPNYSQPVTATELGNQLDDIFDDVLHGGKKKKKKKRHRSSHSEPPKTPTDGASVSEPLTKETNLTQNISLKKFRCKDCTFITADLPCIQEHIHMHQEPFHCSECKTIFAQYSAALEHTITKHAASTPARVVKSPSFNPNDYFDEVMVNGEGKIIEEHARNVNDSLPRRPSEDRDMNYQCQLCEFRTDDRQEIEKHLQSNHRAEYQYVCRICDLAFCKKRETMLKHFKKWHAGLPLDFTTAPGVEEPPEGASQNKTPSRPPSVISIASEDGSPSENSSPAKRVVSSGADNDVVLEMEETPQEAPVAAPVVNNVTPAVLAAETRPCTYKCLECGAKTDAFDVICAHLEVSHPDSGYSFSCPFCNDYRAKTCSFVAEHIRTAHVEHSRRCMERKLENANLFVLREFVDKPPAPPRSDSARSSNQENRSPDDDVMIIDAGQSQTRRPLQPLTLVHHGPPPPEMVQVFPDYSVPKPVFERYQVFNLKPPVRADPPQTVQRMPQPRPAVQQPQMRPALEQAQMMRSPAVSQPVSRPPQPMRPVAQAPRPMPQMPRQLAPQGRHPRPIQPRPMAAMPMQQFPQYYAQPQPQRMMAPTSLSDPMATIRYPLVQEILANGLPTSGPVLYNGVTNPPR